MNDVFEKIANIIIDVADIEREDIEESSQLIDDLDLSSLEIMSIVSKVEKEFSIKISENKLLSISSVKDIVDCVLTN